MVHYQVSLENPNSHLFLVRLLVNQKTVSSLSLSLPNWIPGSYMIRDFSKNIISLEAYVNGEKVNLDKVSKSEWQLAPFSGKLEITYEVYALDLSVRSAYMDNGFAFFNGTSLFLKVSEIKDEPHIVDIVEPECDYCAKWQVLTSLFKDIPSENGFTRYKANNYEHLIDHPFLIGNSVDIAFDVKGITHYLHFVGDIPGNIDKTRLSNDLRRICTQQASLFDNHLPINEYRFLTMVVENGYGGLEHKDSTALVCAPADLPVLGKKHASKNYRNFLGLCSHEYFHLWNVKRIKPYAFQKSDLSKESHSELLWFFEGVTSYYDDLALLRSGCINLEDYLGMLAQTLTRYYRSMGRYRQNLVDSSFDAWTKFYKQDSNAINAIVSYYTKGAIVAFGLDITIRKQSANQLSLNNVMRHLWEKFGKTEIGIQESQLEQEIEQCTGLSLAAFFDSTLRSTQELPIEAWLHEIGIDIRLRQSRSSDDSGGYVPLESIDKDVEIQTSASLGFKFKPGSCVVQYVLRDGPSEAAGISPDDEVVAIDGHKITPSNHENITDLLEINKVVDVHYFRREHIRVAHVNVEEKPLDTCDLCQIPDSIGTDTQKQFLQAWMASLVE